jgi:protein associated with RNAse G/E
MSYRRLILDPRAFKPIADDIDISIYNDAIDAINDAYEYVVNKSETKILDRLLKEVKRNKTGYYD